MEVLLDECLDQRIAAAIQGHEVKTAPEMGWAGFKNGQLLTVAQTEFDVFVTVDRNLPYQQNLPKYTIAIVVLRAKSNRLADLQKLASALLETLPSAPMGKATIVGD